MFKSVCLIALVTLLALTTLLLPGTPTALAAPYLSAPVKTYNYSPLFDSNPPGKLNVVAEISKVFDDGNSTDDWYYYEIRTESVPGQVAYQSGWRTADTWAHHTVAYPGANGELVDHDPQTTSGQSSVNISFSSGVVTVGWSYSTPDVEVNNQSQFDQHIAYWWHDIDEFAAVGQNTYLSKPGFVVKTADGSGTFVDAWYKIQFWKGFSGYVTLGPSQTLFLDAWSSG